MPRRVTKLGLFSFCGVLTGAAVAACGDGRREAASDGAQVADAASHGPSPDAGEPATFSVPPPPPPKGSTRSSGTRPPSVPQDGGFDATRPAPPACTPEGGTDEPDEDFTDTNCDGIDGDVSAAVFVAPTGSDDSDGTLEAPVKTLAHAVELAAETGKSVYACDAEYAEAVTLDGAAVSLYAGYACDHGWRREKDRATVRPAAGVPLTVKATPGAIVIDRFAFRAPDGKDAGASSVAASVVGAKGVTFTRVLLAAGNATSGESGAPVPDPGWTPQEPAADAVTLENAAYCLATGPGAELQGDANCNQVSAGATSDDRTCPFTGHVRGGNGGDGGNYYLALEPTVGGIGLAGGEEHDGLSITVRGFAGAGAESGFGAIDDGAYVASNRGGNARNGFRGHAGRGGNGGASIAGNGSPFVRFGPGGGGGQGGYPGCGGQGGKGGRGGGASIALIAVDSAVTVESSTLITGRGGDGGDGSDGSPGQPGGPGGRGAVMPHGVAGQDGGHGGDGGPGGSGGPGGGGPSIGIVWIGEAVATSTVTFELGRFGRGGKSLDAMAPEGIGAETYSPGESAAAN